MLCELFRPFRVEAFLVSDSSYAVFFLSTGRCGTQWLAKHLKESYGDLAAVAHEPLQLGYRPRALFGHKDPARIETTDKLRTHLERIERLLVAKHYIECGWQCYAVIPHLARRFPGRLRIVHLTRHPVSSASSMVTHRYYSNPPRQDRLTELLLLSPFDAGVRFTGYQDRWGRMDEYEKCLYFWAEVHAYALELEGALGVPWLRLAAEQLFTQPGLNRLLDFLGLPVRQKISRALGQRVDRHRYQTVLDWDGAAIAAHPDVMAVARALGYDPLELDNEALAQRYRLEGSGLKLSDLPGPLLAKRQE